MIPEDIAPLYARLADLGDQAQSGYVGIGDFLSPREAHYAELRLRSMGVRYLMWGGYDEAERKRVYILPDYMETACHASELDDYGFECDICAVRISTDGYRRLSHRDYMGSILGLGVDRAVVGDILVYGENGAQACVFCTSAMSEFFLAELCKVSREKARALFEAKMVEIEYEMADKPDRPVAAGEVIVIRGKGQFIIRSLSDQTKKGRYRLLADKYL